MARFMGPTWGPSEADRTQVGPMLASWTLLSGWLWRYTPVFLNPSHTGIETMLQPIYDHKIRRIAYKSLTNRAIDLRSRGWSYEQIWSQQGRWSCSKLGTHDYKSLKIANRWYMIVRPVVQGRTINHAWLWADKSRDWSCHLWNKFTTGSTIYYDLSRLVARPYIGRATYHLLMVSY